MLLDRALHAEGFVHHEHRQRDEADAQHEQRQRQPPVQHQRRRQQQRDKDEGGKMLAEERHPQPPQRVGAGEHDFHLPAGMLAGMIGERQLQHVLEIIRQHQIAAPVRQPIGEPGDQRAGADNEQAETDPGADERRERPDRRRETCGQRARQRIDDAAEQHRLDELRRGERDIGERQRDGEAGVGAQQAEHAEIEADERHGRVLAAQTRAFERAHSRRIRA